MVLSIGNTSFTILPAGASSRTYTLHNHDVGADGLLLCVFAMSTSTVSYTGCTYGGAPMTLVRAQTYGTLTQRLASYVLLTPPTGVNDIVVSFSATQNGSGISLAAMSFLGAGGIGNELSNGLSATPHSQPLTISANSIIYATGISNNTNTNYDIAGSARTLLFQHNINKQCAGALSATGLASGSPNVITKATFGDITNYRIEIQEAGGGGGGRRRIIIC